MFMIYNNSLQNNKSVENKGAMLFNTKLTNSSFDYYIGTCLVSSRQSLLGIKGFIS